MMRVVIIDDEYFFRKALMNNVPWEENGLTVVGDAKDGQAGLQLIVDKNPDIAIVDINMPVFDGLELIRKARDANMACEYIILTGYDEFHYAKQAVELGVSRYVLKPIDYGDLLDALKTLMERIKNKNAASARTKQLSKNNQKLKMDQLFSDFVNLHLPCENAEPLQRLLAHQNGYAIVLLEPSQTSDFSTMDRLRDWLFLHSNLKTQIFLDTNNRLAIALDMAELQEVNGLINRLLSELPAWAPPLQWSAGKPYPDFENMRRSYSEACLSLKNHLLYENSVGKASAANGFTVSSERIRTLRHSLITGDRRQADQTIEAIYDDLRRRKAQYDEIVLTTLELYGLFCSLTGMSAANEYAQDLPSKIDKLKTIDDFRQWSLLCCRASIDCLIQRKSTISKSTSCVIEYITNNFSDSNISITTLSKKLFVSYSHLCVTFKRDMGVTINEYMQNVRMEEAIRMIEYGAKSITMLAENVGFADVNYFSKCFRKNVGVAPGEYIRMMQR